MPDQSNEEFSVTIYNVGSSNSWQVQLQLFASIYCFLTVNSLLVLIVGVLFNTLPVNNSVVDLMDNSEEKQAISGFFVEVVDIDILNVEAVDPVSELPLFF